MKRIIFRSFLLTITIVIVVNIAKIAPSFIDKIIGPNDNLKIPLAIGALAMIILIVGSGNWLSQKIKSIKRKRRS
jgi:hypothetical protein